MNARAAALLACALALAGQAAAVHAQTAAGAAAGLATELAAPVLNGQGGYRWFGFKLYDARLWREGGVALSEWRTGRFALELCYARALEGKRIAQVSADEIERLGAGTDIQRRQWLERMRVLFPDVVAGNCIAGVHVPGRGARFLLDGKVLGEVADAAFAQAFFGIWLAPGTRAPELRAALLGAQTK
ncbi:MAG TPA: chalcone isomerase family protein [Burkholderiaceae bacterium]